MGMSILEIRIIRHKPEIIKHREEKTSIESTKNQKHETLFYGVFTSLRDRKLWRCERFMESCFEFSLLTVNKNVQIS
jgi:hypothetical protein